MPAWTTLLLANLRYWTRVAPMLDGQIARWQRLAAAIPDRGLREIAASKLKQERFNVELAATAATLAPPPRRHDAVLGIVALQVMYDYLDLLSEGEGTGPSAHAGARLYRSLSDAIELGPTGESDYYGAGAPQPDGGYLEELSQSVKAVIETLPAAPAVEASLRRSAERCAEAQIHCHSLAQTGTAEIERWATLQAQGTDMQWQAVLAGSSASVLALHALIAAAADERTSRAQAERLETTYLAIGALSMLDSIVDRDRDLQRGELNYLRLYDGPATMAAGLARLARQAKRGVRGLPNASQHFVTLVGIVAYYCVAMEDSDAQARAITMPMRQELRPLLAPTMAIMRAWRLKRSLGRAASGAQTAISAGAQLPGHRFVRHSSGDKRCIF